MLHSIYTLHSIPWITAHFTHRTEKVEYSFSFSSELANNRNIFVFREVSTEVSTTEQAANEAKSMAIIRNSLCWVLVAMWHMTFIWNCLQAWRLRGSQREREIYYWKYVPLETPLDFLFIPWQFLFILMHFSTWGTIGVLQGSLCVK